MLIDKTFSDFGLRLTFETRYEWAEAKQRSQMARRQQQNRPPKKRERSILGAVFVWLFVGVIRLGWWLGWRAALVGILILALWTGYYYVQLPPMEAQLDARERGSVLLLDREGEVFAWRGEQFDGSLRATTVSPHLKNAVVATEDKRFYGHFGISPRGIASAVRINLREGRGPLSGHGGSTITQQVAKLLCLGVQKTEAQSQKEYEAECRRTTIIRKLTEVPYSFAMELKYSKDDILSIYLNRAYMGAGAYGFEAAAQRYFSISAREVNVQQAAMLAGLLTAPSRYAPTRNLERSQDRAATVIRLMRDQGYVSEVEADYAMADPATLSDEARDAVGGYFADWIMREAPAFLTTETTEDVHITTTFDRQVQAAAEAAVEKVFSEKVREGSEAEVAVVVLSWDGAVRAIVGGRDPNEQGGLFDRATQARRQTGSAFKPFVYAAALEAGFNPYNVVEDMPLTIEVPGQPPWSPQNYDREYRGEMQLVDALAQSINTVAVRLSEEVGRELVRAVASDFGIDSPLVTTPSVALGVSEMSLMELTGGYAGFRNNGRRTVPYGWIDLRLRGDDSMLMAADRDEGYRVLNPQAAGELVWMLWQVVERGSGRRAALEGWQVAGKTGTTQSARDAWFVGFTSEFVAGVWMGYDDNTPLSGVTGSGLPAEIWHEMMVELHDGLFPRLLPIVEPVPPMSFDAPEPARGGIPLDDLLRGLFGR